MGEVDERLMSASVQELSSAQRSEAVAVLCEAFRDYPVMRYVLAGAEGEYDRRLEVLVDFICERRLEDRGSVLGLEADGALAGVAVVDDPGSGEGIDEEEQRQRVRQLVGAIGGDAVSRLKTYDEVGDALMPAGGYHYLGMLGVLRRFQGRGLARDLVEATQALAEASPRSTGVCLHTETAKNVPLYEHLGYEVVGEADLDALHTWCMFRPCRVEEPG